MDYLRQHKIQISRLCLVIACVYLPLAIFVHISVFYFHSSPSVLEGLFRWPWLSIGFIVYIVALFVGPSGFSINLNKALPPRTRRIAGWIELSIPIIYFIWASVNRAALPNALDLLQINSLVTAMLSLNTLIATLRPLPPVMPRPTDHPTQHLAAEDAPNQRLS